MQPRSPYSRLFALGLGTFALASAAGAQVFGMSAVIVGAEERAGASASQHTVGIAVQFGGGSGPESYFDPVTGYGSSTTYSWQVFATTGGGNVPVYYAGSSTSEPSTAIGYLGTGASGKLSFDFPASTVLSPSFKFILMGCKRTESSGPGGTAKSFVFQEQTFTGLRLRRFAVEVAAVDSRKTYAPPNKDGAYPAVDANAESRNVGFAGWAYRGGLFVGNADGWKGDQSGVARIQCQATDPGSLPACLYTLSIVHIGAPSFFKAATTDWDGSFSLRPYVAGAGAGATVPISSLTWANALLTSACVPGPAISVTGANEYVNVKLSDDSLTTFPSRFLLTASDEAPRRWRYFAGPSYAPASSVAPYAPLYPYSECVPHLWGSESGGVSSVYESNSLTGANPSYKNSARWSFN